MTDIIYGVWTRQRGIQVWEKRWNEGFVLIAAVMLCSRHVPSRPIRFALWIPVFEFCTFAVDCAEWFPAEDDDRRPTGGDVGEPVGWMTMGYYTMSCRKCAHHDLLLLQTDGVWSRLTCHAIHVIKSKSVNALTGDFWNNSEPRKLMDEQMTFIFMLC